MNKKEYIKIEIAKNEQAFGRWASTDKLNSADPIKIVLESSPRNAEEALQHGNALANTGNYPVGTSECFNVGISGGCGTECFVYLKGKCGEPQEMLPRLTEEELEQHNLLYPKVLP
jgi:hypothetical protein